MRVAKDLTPGDAAVALIVQHDGRYLMQLRSQTPGIFYPGHWGLFGGAVDDGESADQALLRELREELGLEFEDVQYFTEFSFDFGFLLVVAASGGATTRYRSPLAWLTAWCLARAAN